MKATHAAVIEPNPAGRRRLLDGLKKAGLKPTAIASAAELSRADVVVLGSTLKDPAKVARQVRAALPKALVLAAQQRVGKASWADAIVPLPLSPKDLQVRLPELARLFAAKTAASALVAKPRAAPVPAPRPGEGILDPLTGFYTFAHFKEVLFVEVKRARRYGFPLSVALIAFDPFPIDVPPELSAQLMGGLALAIRRSLRDTDYPVRYGEGRVLLLMPHTDLAGALVVSRRINERVGKAQLSHEGRVLAPKVSIGVSSTGAARPGTELSFADLARHAQQCLDAAIAAGGDRVEFHDSAAAESATEG